MKVSTIQLWSSLTQDARRLPYSSCVDIGSSFLIRENKPQVSTIIIWSGPCVETRGQFFCLLLCLCFSCFSVFSLLCFFVIKGLEKVTIRQYLNAKEAKARKSPLRVVAAQWSIVYKRVATRSPVSALRIAINRFLTEHLMLEKGAAVPSHQLTHV